MKAAAAQLLAIEVRRSPVKASINCPPALTGHFFNGIGHVR
jgi:hypothetical protein